MTHYGTNGIAACGESRLLTKSTTLDLQAVDCVTCLFQLWGQGIAAVDTIAQRVHVVTKERMSTINVGAIQ